MTDSEHYPCTLKCAPFELIIDSVFWHILSQKKLQNYRLEEGPFALTGHFEIGYFEGSPCRVSLDFRAFDENLERDSQRSFLIRGQLFVFNTLERFKENILQQSSLLQRGQWLKNCLLQQSDALSQNPNSLLQLMLLIHADLKKHLFRFRSAFPTLGLEPPPELISPPTVIKEVWSEEKMNSLMLAFDQFASNSPDFMFFIKSSSGTSEVQLLPMSADVDLADPDVLLCVCDASTQPRVPGWTLRCGLMLIAAKFVKHESQSFPVLCLRDRVQSGVRSVAHSLLLNVRLHRFSEQIADSCQIWGWENLQKPWHFLNLSTTMDPNKLADSAVNLNLELMRWRLLPQLNLSVVASTRCLLFGCGTLGCNVARQLLAWGVRTISLVDYGTVSYSNPVRQTLFEHVDCFQATVAGQSLHDTPHQATQGAKSKALAGADALKRIFPGVNATGYCLSVPMPGHAVSSLGEEQIAKTQKDCELIEKLVEEHDVLFLLMDSREGRWLPSLLGKKHGKLVINAALGFDSYLVMRHGVRSPHSNTPSDVGFSGRNTLIPGDQLGCYFCSDVVGPSNSMRDRSLDQQCTVTRPGLSMIAAGLAVELMVSTLQRKSGARASADLEDQDPDEDSPLGLVPHQIRGFLSKHSILLPSVRAFRQCTACSDLVLEYYEKEGFPFILRVLDDPAYLEEVTGLKKLQEDTNCLDTISSWSDDDDEEF